MTGAGTAATLGYPDYGLVTMSEMADNAGRIAASVDVPVIADTGYGNELNATRTVREYERRGVAGLHIEDQDFPKKCGHLDDKVIVPGMRSGRHPVPEDSMTVRDAFRRVGADEWDAVSERFHSPAQAAE
jgi:hypothetical protein